jgi:hypothetical protein
MDSKQERELHKNAKELINQISVVLRTSQIHDTNNVALASSISRLVAMINSLVSQENILALELRGEFFYINEYRIRYSLEYLLNFDFMVREFKKRELGNVTFKGQIRSDDIKRFIKAFVDASFSQEPFSTIQEEMTNVRNIDVGVLKKVVEDDSLDVRKMVKKTYFNAVSFTQGVINKIRSGEKVNIKKAKRVVE